MSDYGVLWGATEPGCMLDSSRYIIDGTGVCKDESILIGKVVMIDEIVDGYRMITSQFNQQIRPCGIVLRTHSCLYADEASGYMVYRSGDPINVVRRGRVWALTEQIDSAPNYGQAVYVADDGFVNTGNGQIVDGWTFTGDFMKYDKQFNLVGVNLSVVKLRPIGPPQVPVKAALIESDITENDPQPNNKPIQLRVTVKPDNATDKTGTWSCWEDEARTSEVHNIADVDQNGLVTPTGTAEGTVFINWDAKDGSGVSDTYVLDFVNPALP